MKTKNIDFMNDIKLTSFERIKPFVKDNMIQPPFVSGFIGTRGSGKTYTSVKLILELIKEGALKEQDIYFIAPSFYKNEVFHNIHNIKKKNILTRIKDVYGYLEKITAHFEFILRVWNATKKKYTKQQYDEWYKTIIDKLDAKNKEDEDDLSIDLNNIEYLHLKLNNCESRPYFYDYVPHFLIFIDDASHSKIYKNRDSNPFINFFLRHRHYNCSIMCAAQTYRNGITRDLRLNMSCWFIWKQSEEDVKNIYSEVISSVVRKKRLFFELFDKITDKDHDFILIDKEAKNKSLIIRKNFDQILDPLELDKLFGNNNYIHGESKDKTHSKIEESDSSRRSSSCAQNEEIAQGNTLSNKKIDNTRIEKT